MFSYTDESKKSQVINQQFISIEEELKERNPTQAYRMVQKIQDGYRLHTNLCKDKEQIKWR